VPLMVVPHGSEKAGDASSPPGLYPPEQLSQIDGAGGQICQVILPRVVEG
jgi:hypothetical protein